MRISGRGGGGGRSRLRRQGAAEEEEDARQLERIDGAGRTIGYVWVPRYLVLDIFASHGNSVLRSNVMRLDDAHDPHHG